MAEFKEVMKQKNRMCDYFIDNKCKECKISYSNNGVKLRCMEFCDKYPDQAEEIIMKWAEENPKVTILDKLLEVFPDVELEEDGTPSGFCPANLGYEVSCNINEHDCKKCWSQPYKVKE